MKLIYCNLLLSLFLITSCTTTRQVTDTVPLYETFTIQSIQVAELRTINVWTPPDYKTTIHSLPVLYMPDGGLKEDFPHIANTIAALVESKKIRPLILVGIENTQRRRDLTGPTQVEKDKEIAPVVGGSAQFRAFINDELFTEINKRYRTTKEKGIIGESLAGLFVTETFLLHPNMFDYYIAFDPSLWWNNEHLIKNAKEDLNKFPSAKKRFWFAGSKDVLATVQKLDDTLKAANINTIKWQYANEPKEEHSTIFRATKEKAIIWTLGQKQ
jgi:hypothetical protein